MVHSITDKDLRLIVEYVENRQLARQAYLDEAADREEYLRCCERSGDHRSRELADFIDQAEAQP